jgi:hypothetical protein
MLIPCRSVKIAARLPTVCGFQRTGLNSGAFEVLGMTGYEWDLLLCCCPQLSALAEWSSPKRIRRCWICVPPFKTAITFQNTAAKLSPAEMLDFLGMSCQPSIANDYCCVVRAEQLASG